MTEALGIMLVLGESEGMVQFPSLISAPEADGNNQGRQDENCEDSKLPIITGIIETSCKLTREIVPAKHDGSGLSAIQLDRRGPVTYHT
jgi:hypothetical protein